MNTNPFIDPNITDLGGPRICEPLPRIECHSGQHGASNVVVRIANAGEVPMPNWWVAFPGLGEVDEESEFRS